MCLVWIPVRSVIHWSLVATIFSRSAFVSNRGGTYVPTQLIFARTWLCGFNVRLKLSPHCLSRSLYSGTASMPADMPYGPAIILSDPRPKNKCHPCRRHKSGPSFAALRKGWVLRAALKSILNCLGGAADQTTSVVN
jgi:hypothetical protein